MISSSERCLHTGDGHPAFTDCCCTTFHRAGPDIARGENVWKTRFERSRLAFIFFPRGSVRYVRSRFDKSFFVALDLDWQPFGARDGADHGKDCRRFDNAPLASLGIFQLGFLERFVPRHFSDLGVIKNVDVRCRFHPSRKIGRHLGKIFSPNDEQHFGSAIGKKHCGLAG